MKFSIVIALILIKIARIQSLQSVCSDQCGNKTRINSYFSPNCFCDECDIYNDCCTDVQQKPVDLDFSKAACNIRISEYEYVYSIVKCDNWWKKNDIIRYKCEKQTFRNLNEKKKLILNYLPVYSEQTNLTYKNKYCAKCNIKEIEKKKLIHFQLKPTPEFLSDHEREIDSPFFLKKILQEFIVNDTNTGLYFALDGIQKNLRKCIISIDKCSEKSSIEEKIRCSNYTAYRYNIKKGVFYRNVHCGLCNGEALEDLECGRMNRILMNTKNLQLLFDISNILDKNETCSSDDTRDDTLSIENEIKKYLTIIGHFVSIVSLIFLLIVYSASKKLRNFPGKLMICLSLALMCSQFFFTLSTYMATPSVPLEDCETQNNFFDLNVMLTPCYILAFLAHYFYLSFFAWTNVMAFDLYSVFATISSKSSRSGSINGDDQEMKNLRFLKYSAFAWLLPLFVCLLTIIKQFYMNNLSYAFKTCFIEEKIDLLVFFILPVSAVLFSNIFFLIHSIDSIRRVDRATKKFLKKEPSENTPESSAKVNKKKPAVQTNNQEKSRLVLFLKLFFLSGMTWILGVVCTLVHRDSFIWYIYIVLNSLQGLFIFVSFAFSPQSRRHFKNSKFFTNLSSVVSKKDRSKSDMGTSSSFI